jgi:hypothetical protein
MKPEVKEILNNRIEEHKILSLRALKILVYRARVALLQTRSSRRYSKEKREMLKKMLSNLRAEKQNLKTFYDYISSGVNEGKFNEFSVSECLKSLKERNKEMFEKYTQYLESKFYKVEPIGMPYTLEPGYGNDVGSLAITKEDVKRHLSYMSPEFWEYMERTESVYPCDDAKSVSQAFGATSVRSIDGKTICEIKSIVPHIHDLASAKEASRVYVKAYEIYKCLGEEKVDPSRYSDAKEISEYFESQYLGYAPERVRLATRLKNARRKDSVKKEARIY